ncbi:MAG: GAF domain-containing protein, partial [Bacteroidota bacterium]
MKKKTSDAVTEELRIKNSLLKITGGLAKIRNRTELLRYIFHEIKKVFPFDTAGLFVMDEAADTFEEILEKGTLDDLQDEVATKQLLGPWSYAGHDARAWIYVEEPTLYNIEEQSKIYPNPQWKYMQQAGLQQMIAGALYHQGKKIGLLCFSSTSADCFLANNFPLFQAIANQLAVTVNNVLANEQLMEEQHFKETLLCISEAVATIQNRSQLFRVIFDRVQPILPFDAPGLFIIDGDQHYEILDEASASDVCNELVREGVGAIPFDNKTSFVQELIESEKTYIRPTSEIEHPQIEIMLTAGLRQIMYAPLKNAGKVIGVFILNSKQANKYRETDIPLFQAIADQFAIAVSNVLANERLVEEKKFSNTLLKITEAVASVNNTKELYKTIFTTIKPVLPFDELGLFALDDTGDMHYELIDESVLDRTDVQQLVEEKLGKHTRYKHRGSSVEWLMENGPIALSMAQLDKNAPHPQHQYMIAGGVQSILGGPLIHGGEAFGLLCFTAMKEDFYNEKDY